MIKQVEIAVKHALMKGDHSRVPHALSGHPIDCSASVAEELELRAQRRGVWHVLGELRPRQGQDGPIGAPLSRLSQLHVRSDVLVSTAAQNSSRHCRHLGILDQAVCPAHVSR